MTLASAFAKSLVFSVDDSAVNQSRFQRLPFIGALPPLAMTPRLWRYTHMPTATREPCTNLSQAIGRLGGNEPKIFIDRPL